MSGLFDEEHKIRIARSCAFADWFGVYEVNGEKRKRENNRWIRVEVF